MNVSRVAPNREAETTVAREPISHRWVLNLAWALGVLVMIVCGVLVWWWLSVAALRGRIVDASDAVERNEYSSETLRPLISELERASRWFPSDALLYRQLARAQGLVGDLPEAVISLEAAYRLQPQSVLVWEELATAYEAAGAIERADELWRALGLTGYAMASRAEHLTTRGAYSEALDWYVRALRHGAELDQSQLFSATLSAVIADNELIMSGTAIPWPSFRVDAGHLQIDGAALRWKKALPSFNLRPGDLLAHQQIGDRVVGVMWWDGLAVALVDVPKAGLYKVAVRAQNSQPAPISLVLEHNNQVVQRFDYVRGDGSWQEQSTVVELHEGLHVIGIRFLENSTGDGLDRDAFIDWVMFEAKS